MGVLDSLYFAFSLISVSFIAVLVIYLKLFDENSFFAIILVGTVIFYNMGLKGIFPLLFFVFSSLFWGSFRKIKHKPRGYKEVLANGLVPAFLSFFDYHLFLSSLCALISDTWSSEIGISFSKKAYSLKGFKRVEAGEPGAVSFIGTLGGFLGSIIFSLFSLKKNYIFPVMISGFVSNLIDSFMGAYFEKKYKFFTSDLINFLISIISPFIFWITVIFGN